MKMQQQKLWRNSSKKICKSYCSQGDWQSDFKKYNERGMAGDGCASFLVTGKSRKQQFFGGSGTRVQKAGERSNGSRGTSGRTPHCDFWRACPGGDGMIFQSIKMAWNSIASNKMRSFLTMLGIIIGVASLIVLVSIADGAIRKWRRCLYDRQPVSCYGNDGERDEYSGVESRQKTSDRRTALFWLTKREKLYIIKSRRVSWWNSQKKEQFSAK